MKKTNLLELYAKIGVKDEASSAISSFASSAVKKLASVAASIVSIQSAWKLFSSSLNNVAEYEQLAGGVEKLFQTASDEMIGYAKAAATTANMSTNEYIQSVTSFSAAMIKSLNNDYSAAAKMSDKAMRQIADNANTFGVYTTQELAHVYQSLAKGQYMLLDNLNLGYAGTKEGLQKLLDDASAYTEEKTGEMKEYSVENFADIVEAIGTIQDKLHITGTTAKEASETIQGSINTLKASWENLKGGTGTVDEFGEAFRNAARNVIKATAEIVPRLVKEIPQAAKQALQGIWEGLGETEIGRKIHIFTNAIMINLKPALDNLKSSLEPIISKIKEFGQAIAEHINVETFVKIGEILGNFINMLANVIDWVVSHFSEIAAGIAMVAEVIAGIKIASKISKAISIIKSLGDVVKWLWIIISSNPIGAVLALIGVVIAYLVNLYMTNEDFRNKVNEIWNNIVEFVSGAVQSIVTFFSETLPTAIQNLISWFQQIPQKVTEFVAQVREKAVEFVTAGVEMITGFIQSLYQGFLSLLTSVGEWVQANIIQPIKDKVGGMLEAGQDLVARVKEGLQDGFSGLLSAVGGWVNDYIIQPIKNKATEMYNAGKNIINNLWNGLKDAWASVKAWWDGLSFSIKRATVVVDNPAGATPKAQGMDYVPYDNYVAALHRGEMVLTKAEAAEYKKGESKSNGITIVQNISATPQTPVDFAAATAAYFEQARWALI